MAFVRLVRSKASLRVRCRWVQQEISPIENRRSERVVKITLAGGVPTVVFRTFVDRHLIQIVNRNDTPNCVSQLDRMPGFLRNGRYK